MTKTQRERWNHKTLAKTRKHLRTNLQILTFTSDLDKEEIEARVMADIEGAVASVSDFDLDHGYSPSSFESDADTLALGIIQEQDWRREMERGY